MDVAYKLMAIVIQICHSSPNFTGVVYCTMKQAAAISALLLVPLHLDPAGGKLFLWQSVSQLYLLVWHCACVE
jgi:hypothetical protein